MGRRSDFPRIERDAYQTIDPRAVERLLPHLRGIRAFAEPCAGEGHLVGQLQAAGLICAYEGDITTGHDALTYDFQQDAVFDAIITNPPWGRASLHPMIERFMRIAPTWLLLDAGWSHTRQAGPFIDQCSHIISIGRLRWIPGTTMAGKDDCVWMRFHAQHTGGPKFVGREVLAC